MERIGFKDMSRLTSIATAFVAGGVVGIIGNALYSIMLFAGIGESLAPLATLLVLGITGCALFAAGKGKKLTESQSSISFLPFYGLGTAIAQAQLHSRLAGNGFLASFLKSWQAFFVATGIGIALSLATGFVVALL